MSQHASHRFTAGMLMLFVAACDRTPIGPRVDEPWQNVPRPLLLVASGATAVTGGNSLTDSLWAVDPASGQAVRRWSAGTASLLSVTVSPSHSYAISLTTGNNLFTIDLGKGQHRVFIRTGASDVAFLDDTTAAVSLTGITGGGVILLNARSGDSIAFMTPPVTNPTEGNPTGTHAVATSPAHAHQVWSIQRRQFAVTRMDFATGEMDQFVYEAEVTMPVMGPAGDLLWLKTDATLLAVDPFDGQIMRSFDVPRLSTKPFSYTVSSTGSHIWVAYQNGWVVALDAHTGLVLTQRQFGGIARGIVESPDRTRLYVALHSTGQPVGDTFVVAGNGVVKILDAATLAEIDELPVGSHPAVLAFTR